MELRALGLGHLEGREHPPEVEDGTAEAQKALEAAHGTGQRFGAAHLIDVLRGANTEKVRAAGHDRLPAYGAGGDIAKEEWRSILRQLVAAGFLQLDVAGHGGLSITARGADLVNGEETFRYRKDTRPATAVRARRAGASAKEVSASASSTVGLPRPIAARAAVRVAAPTPLPGPTNTAVLRGSDSRACQASASFTLATITDVRLLA